MDKIWINLYCGLLFNHNENEVMSFAGKLMKLDIIMLRDKPNSNSQRSIFLCICGIYT
jgi:hypothetical protein